ncbi:MAG: bacillithiol biosynthesis deacetylase BshB1 [Planctomycetes bacterium]|nr:bacillithiol biosynthesis deacetylase BshB1 [Planctomycetota bacterium]
MVDVLVFGPHPDDIEICAGGLVLSLRAQGYSVGGIDMTAGESGTRGSAADRSREATEGARLLGLEFRECLGLPDGRIALDEPTRDRVIEVIRRHRPQLVVAPIAVDHHPDHSRTGTLVKEARFLAGCARIGPELPPWRPGRVLFYPSRESVEPSLVVDIGVFFEGKMAAVRAHRSQLHDPASSEPLTAIASEGFLKAIEARAVAYGSMVGATHGEPYVVEGPLAVSDPVPLVRDLGQSVFL